MKTWKRITALCVSISTMGITMLSSSCDLVSQYLGNNIWPANSQENSQESSTESVSNSSTEEHTHVWEEKIVLNPTCTERGTKVIQCACGEETYEEVAPSHSLLKTEISAATCTQEGIVEFYCENCEYKQWITEPTTAHFFMLDGACFWCGQTREQINGGVGEKKEVTLTVSVQNGGLGKVYLDEAADRFEEIYNSQQSAINLTIEVKRDDIVGNRFLERTLDKDIYFASNFDYLQLVAQGKAAPLTSIVHESMQEYGENGSIEDKLPHNIRYYLTAQDGEYYMLPYLDLFFGFVYDVDLFEEKGFYFDKNGEFLRVSGTGNSTREEFEAAKSNGPDGIEGTYDDGLPATYEQMLALLDYMVYNDVIPFCYEASGDYVNYAFHSFIADYEGYDSMMLNYTLNGVATIVDEIADGKVTKTCEVAVTPDNAYILQKQAGRYYALAMEEALFGTTKYMGGEYSTMNLTQAQAVFLNSKYNAQPYAMLLDGIWWENEADALFKTIETYYGEKKTDRRFGFLPIPKADESRLGDQTMWSQGNSFCFINSQTTNMEIAQEFMKFLHTDAEMIQFTAQTSMTRSLNYHIPDAVRETMTYFGRSVVDMKDSAKVVYSYPMSEFIVNNPVPFSIGGWYSTSLMDGDIYYSLFNALRDGGVKAIDYFEGLYTYQESLWSELYY